MMALCSGDRLIGRLGLASRSGNPSPVLSYWPQRKLPTLSYGRLYHSNRACPLISHGCPETSLPSPSRTFPRSEHDLARTARPYRYVPAVLPSPRFIAPLRPVYAESYCPFPFCESVRNQPAVLHHVCRLTPPESGHTSRLSKVCLSQSIRW